MGRRGCSPAGQPTRYHSAHGRLGRPAALIPYPLDLMTTLHCYSETLHSGERLAATVWAGGPFGRTTAAAAVAATLRQDGEAIVLRVADASGRYVAIGHAPGGLA